MSYFKKPVCVMCVIDMFVVVCCSLCKDDIDLSAVDIGKCTATLCCVGMCDESGVSCTCNGHDMSGCPLSKSRSTIVVVEIKIWKRRC